MTDPRPYHHGDLRAALLQAARSILETDGIAALKLRAITRLAGVSATAATPHFRNLAGLLSALAATGFEELGAAMAQADTPAAIGRAYIRFAVANPGLFTLMFRLDALDRADPHFTAAARHALSGLGRAARTTPDLAPDPAHMAARWGIAHGLAVLAIDGMLGTLAGENSAEAALRLAEAALQAE